MINPQRGEVWRVDLDPTRGRVLACSLPVVVMNEPGIGRASVRVCVPITNWQPAHAAMFWCWPLAPDENGLTKDSSADASQVRALDVARFIDRLGVLAGDDVEAIAEVVALTVGFKA